MIPDNRLAIILFTAIASGTLFVALASSSEKTYFKAGFDCNKAESTIERLICSDEKLARADMQLNLNYQKLLPHLTKPDANELKSNQASWLKSRDKCCSESDSIVGCIQVAYQRRNELLSGWNLAAERNFFKRVYWIDKNPSLIPLKVMPEEPDRSLERYRIVADFNNDGIEDVALSHEINMFGNAGGYFSLYLGKADGGFRESQMGRIF